MLTKMTSGALGLLAFAATIFAGVWAGNDVTVVLERALWSLISFLILGAICGWIAQIVINEHIKNSTQQMMEHLQPDSNAQRAEHASGASDRV
jgi:uncharacterized membrane protein